MTDPWADVREAITNVDSWAKSDPSSGRFIPMNQLDYWLEMFKKIEADADALLAFKEVVESCGFYSNTVERDVDEILKALAALPEHLK